MDDVDRKEHVEEHAAPVGEGLAQFDPPAQHPERPGRLSALGEEVGATLDDAGA